MNRARYKLETVKASDSIRAALRTEHVRIWSGEWGLWWRPGCAGYTATHDEAGVYSFEDAWNASAHCGPEKAITFEVALSSEVTK